MSNEVGACYHCHLPIKGTPPFYAEIDGIDQPMCCAGCKAVAEMIAQSGLTRYYDHRETGAIRPVMSEQLIPAELKRELTFYDHPDIAQQFVYTRKTGDKEFKESYLIVDNIVCAACVWLLENGLKSMDGVEAFDINYTTHRAHVTFDPEKVKLSEILMEVIKLGYEATPYDEQTEQKQLKKEWRSLLIDFGIAALFSMQVMMTAVGIYFGKYNDMSQNSYHFLNWFNMFAAIPCVTYASRSFYKAAYHDLKNRRLSMNVNVSLAIIVGTIWSIWNTIAGQDETYYESVTMFAFLLLGARVLETNARHKALLVSDHILKVKPHFAERLLPDGSTEPVPTQRLQMGDHLLIKPGDSIPLDGVLLDDVAMVDESLLTGESLPLEKRKGDRLIGGSVNYEQPLKMEVTAIGAETVLSQMARLIDRSMTEKPKIAQLADIISTYFVLGIIMACVGTFIVWYNWIDPSRAFSVTLTVLVVSCPCALALATPAALSTGNQAIIEKGLIATRSGALETLGKITDIVFDKTGTLTEGKLTINAIHYFDESMDEAYIKQIGAALEASSSHPIAYGFRKLSEDESLEPLLVHNLLNHVGKGISGEVDGVEYKIGRLDWFDLTGHHERFDDGLWVGLGKGDQLIAAFSLLDRLKDDTLKTVESLREAGYTLHILSGDRGETVKRFNETLNIEEAHGDLLPEEKLHYVEKLQKNGARVAMLGDGINDGPVLAKADVSIAIGQGALLAQTTADMILMKDQKLEPLVDGIVLAKRTDRIINQNLAWALGYNLVAIPIAMFGVILPWMAALGMSLSSLLVIGNTLRIRGGDDE